MCAMPFRLFAYLQIQKNQSHYIEVMQGATFCGKEYEIWADFGPVGNTEKQILGQMQRYTYRVLQKIQMKLLLLCFLFFKEYFTYSELLHIFEC